jgi:hypothetical protein
MNYNSLFVICASSTGAPLFGSLDDTCSSLPDLSASHLENRTLLDGLREGSFADELHAITLDDASKGRMTKPVPAGQVDLTSVRLAPRFAVAQGLKEDGSIKLRAVDHLSYSAPLCGQKRTRHQVKADSLNGHCQLAEKVTHDHLDGIAAGMRLFIQNIGEVPHLWKADIDAAFRRVPLRPAHSWAAGVAYVAGGQKWISFHHAMPFGATSSVFAWHKIGELLCRIARKVFHLPVYRYVDDYFAFGRCCLLVPSNCICVCFLLHLPSPDTIQHAMQVFARLVRVLLGESAIADRKLEHGQILVVLGMSVNPSPLGIRLHLSRQRAEKWLADIDTALSTDCLLGGQAQKLSGRLGWSTQHLFHR